MVFVAMLLLSCTAKKTALYQYESETMKIRQVGNNLFMHVSYLNTNDFGKVACNGMVYFNGKEAIVFDTPTDNASSLELISWIQEKQHKQIKAIVVTHFHKDCLGGLEAFHENGTTSYAHQGTMGILEEKDQATRPNIGFEKKAILEVGDQQVYATFFGEGHTKDNIVGYVPEENALFGGCLIKAANASKGNLEDANTNEWSKTVARIKKEYPELQTIVPGHGQPGGTELLDYTIRLFEN